MMPPDYSGLENLVRALLYGAFVGTLGLLMVLGGSDRATTPLGILALTAGGALDLIFLIILVCLEKARWEGRR